jgi:hypothetical protein
MVDCDKAEPLEGPHVRAAQVRPLLAPGLPFRRSALGYALHRVNVRVLVSPRSVRER